VGIVFDIQKFSVHDGPGIRTTVFLKGCNLRCRWCHNPESFLVRPQLSFDKNLCVECRACEKVCPNQVHLFQDSGHYVDFSKCEGCGRCVEACATKCLILFGKNRSASDILSEVLKDKRYYDSSGGGVTFSGGEPSVQFEFLLELLKKSKEQSLHVCLETNGILSEERCSRLIPFVDLFIVDYKATDSLRHYELTGAGNDTVLHTLELLDESNKPVLLRCPMIPGVNNTPEHFEMIRRLKESHKNIIKAEVMAYHSYGKKKWDSIGYEYKLMELEDVTDLQRKEWQNKVDLI
jgi:pyruvate formate lyase activating enzyme